MKLSREFDDIYRGEVYPMGPSPIRKFGLPNLPMKQLASGAMVPVRGFKVKNLGDLMFSLPNGVARYRPGFSLSKAASVLGIGIDKADEYGLLEKGIKVERLATKVTTDKGWEKIKIKPSEDDLEPGSDAHKVSVYEAVLGQLGHPDDVLEYNLTNILKTIKKRKKDRALDLSDKARHVANYIEFVNPNKEQVQDRGMYIGELARELMAPPSPLTPQQTRWFFIAAVAKLLYPGASESQERIDLVKAALGSLEDDPLEPLTALTWLHNKLGSKLSN